MIEILNSDKDYILKSINQLNENKIISFATDTVYGFACKAESDEAVLNLYKIKSRSHNKPVAILVKNLEMATDIFDLTNQEINFIKNFVPGPITVIAKIKNNENLSKYLNIQNKSLIGFRIIKHEFTNKLFEIYNFPLALTSANLSGEDNIINDIDFKNKFLDNKNILFIKGFNCLYNRPSTVISLENGLKIIREGEISANEILSKYEK